MPDFPRTLAAAPARQRGAVLFIALVFLLLMSILAIVASRTSVLQERMTGGARSNQLGLMGAESVLRESEFRLWTLSQRTSMASGGLQMYCGPAGTLGSCFTRRAGTVDPRVLKFRDPAETEPPADISSAYGPQISAITDITDPRATGSLAQQPRVIYEDLGEIPPPGRGRMRTREHQGGVTDPETLHLYRMTARSPGGSTNVQRVAESTFLAMVPKSVVAGN
jgi:type IV pilus assembly protein PilX